MIAKLQSCQPEDNSEAHSDLPRISRRYPPIFSLIALARERSVI